MLIINNWLYFYTASAYITICNHAYSISYCPNNLHYGYKTLLADDYWSSSLILIEVVVFEPSSSSFTSFLFFSLANTWSCYMTMKSHFWFKCLFANSTANLLFLRLLVAFCFYFDVRGDDIDIGCKYEMIVIVPLCMIRPITRTTVTVWIIRIGKRIRWWFASFSSTSFILCTCFKCLR